MTVRYLTTVTSINKKKCQHCHSDDSTYIKSFIYLHWNLLSLFVLLLLGSLQGNGQYQNYYDAQSCGYRIYRHNDTHKQSSQYCAYIFYRAPIYFIYFTHALFNLPHGFLDICRPRPDLAHLLSTSNIILLVFISLAFLKCLSRICLRQAGCFYPHGTS